MITILEPCCIDHQFGQLIDSLRKEGKSASFIGYGDWDAAQLFQVSVPRVGGGFVGISTGIPNADFISTVRRMLSATLSGASDRFNIDEMVWIIPPCNADLKKELMAQLGSHIKSRRLTICEDSTGMRCYMVMGPLYHFVISGNMYMGKCSGVLQHYTLLTDKGSAADMVGVFRTQAKLRPSFRKERTKECRVQKGCTDNVKEP